MAELFDAMIRHQVYVEGLKRGQGMTLAQSLLKLNTDIKAELANVSFANLGDMSRTKLGELLLSLKKLADTVFNAWLNDLIAWLQRYMVIDCDLLKKIFEAVSPNVEASDFDKSKDGAALWTPTKNTPLSANGLLLLPFLSAFAIGGTGRIVSLANMAWANRATPAQLAAAIAGAPIADRNPLPAPVNPAAGQGSAPAAAPLPISPLPMPQGGALGLLQRQGEAVINTVVQHVAAQSNMNTAKAAFEQYLWVSVLDSATTEICRSRNGNVYVYGAGPLPPAHINCRSSTVPFDGSAPVTMPSFTMWANGQAREFVNDAFDGEPGSTYEGSRAVNLEKFAGKFGLITA